MSFLEIFEKAYAPKLDVGRFQRAAGFRKMFEHLEGRNHPIIIETGTMRSVGNWSDGQSTLLWDRLLDYKEQGSCISIDISGDNISAASPHVRNVVFLQGDSVYTLQRLSQVSTADLIYLDSYDLDQSNPMPSAIHHLMELTAIYGRLRSGCMVVVDDCISNECGKHMLVKKFFDTIGLRPCFEGYQCGWLVL